MEVGRVVIKLSVNINKVATVRNSRGGSEPSVLDAAKVCVAAGAPGLTVHPRADARHITTADVRELAPYVATLGGRVELILDAGPAPGGAPSTIIDVTQDTARLVRNGAVPWDRVLQFL